MLCRSVGTFIVFIYFCAVKQIRYENFICAIICLSSIVGCSNDRVSDAAVGECNMVEFHKEKFDSFLTQFAQFSGVCLDESFFRVCENFPGELGNVVFDRYYFSYLLPYDDECNCVPKELYCWPCYKVENKNFYLLSINVCCDVTKTECYPYVDNMLVAYDKK